MAATARQTRLPRIAWYRLHAGRIHGGKIQQTKIGIANNKEIATFLIGSLIFVSENSAGLSSKRFCSVWATATFGRDNAHSVW